MVNYRRDRTKGGTYFFTLSLKNRDTDLLTRHIKLLGRSFRRAKKTNPFVTKAIVVLPEHLHAIWELPQNDDDYSTRWRQIKTYFLQEVLHWGEPLLRNQRNEYNLWQRRFWEHRIRNETDFFHHVNYIHYNPVKHQLVQNVSHWPYSSFHAYVNKGIIAKNWSDHSEQGCYGESD
ncbi:transposase [Legionella israelensis]|uniref:Transposase n=1 Tax=Legionella israelensis TaxID=454 RepID=A0AAX1EER3_9GAMM|nr:transposase [Legionella israelensis]QBR83522.1 transposase [Legionella israelensis]